MSKILPSDSKYVLHIADLVNLAQINYFVCKSIYDSAMTKSAKHPNRDFFLLAANNSFNETISIIHTLLTSIKDEEIRIKPALEESLKNERIYTEPATDELVGLFVGKIENDYPDIDYSTYEFLYDGYDQSIGNNIEKIRSRLNLEKGLVGFQALKDKFESFNFHKIRHQSVAHKNKALVAPAGGARLLIRDDVLNNLGEIVKELKIQNFIWFNYQVGNPQADTLHSLNELLKSVESNPI